MPGGCRVGCGQGALCTYTLLACKHLLSQLPHPDCTTSPATLPIASGGIIYDCDQDNVADCSCSFHTMYPRLFRQR